jgi:thymidine kinase
MNKLFTYESGFIEVICGPMFAGKTEELLRRIKRLELAGVKYLVFKHKLDGRYSTEEEIVSHCQDKCKCICIKDSSEIEKYLSDEIEVVIIDEAQFFDDGIIKVCDKLADDGYKVIVAGLDRDFKGEPFGPMPFLLAIAEFVTKLTAVCQISKAAATRTQRLINGKPASVDDKVIMVGAKETYQAVSRNCHKVPGKQY